MSVIAVYHSGFISTFYSIHTKHNTRDILQLIKGWYLITTHITPKIDKRSAHLTIAERCTPTNLSMVTTIRSLFDRATADRHMYDGGVVSSFDSHFANISDFHETSTLINIV